MYDGVSSWGFLLLFYMFIRNHDTILAGLCIFMNQLTLILSILPRPVCEAVLALAPRILKAFDYSYPNPRLLILQPHQL